jgi:hypothetical protein
MAGLFRLGCKQTERAGFLQRESPTIYFDAFYRRQQALTLPLV